MHPLASQMYANLLFDQYRKRKYRLRRANNWVRDADTEGLEYGVELKVGRKCLGSLYCPGSSVEPDQLCCRTYVLYRLFKQLYLITAYTVIARFVVQEFTEIKWNEMKLKKETEVKSSEGRRKQFWRVLEKEVSTKICKKERKLWVKSTRELATWEWTL